MKVFKNPTLKEQAIQELIKHGQTSISPVVLNEALRSMPDNNLFALYFDIFGHAVGEKAA